MVGALIGECSRQPSGCLRALKAAARFVSSSSRPCICFPSASLAQRHYGTVSTLPATVPVPSLNTHELSAASHAFCTSTGGDVFYAKSARSRFDKGHKHTSQGSAIAHLLKGGSSNSPTGTVGDSRPPKGVLNRRADQRSTSELQRCSSDSRSIRPDDQLQQYRGKAQSDASRQLMSNLKSSKTPQQLLQLAQRHGKQFDHILIAAAVTHLGQWKSKRYIKATDHQVVQQLLQLLEQLLSPPILQRCQCRQLSNMIWACCLLEYVQTPLLRTCLGELVAKLSSSRTLQDVSIILYGSAQSRAEVPTHQLQQLIAAAGRPDLLDNSTPQSLANIIWAVSKMGQKIPEQQLCSMLDSLLSNDTDRLPQDISSTLWGLATMTATVPLLQLQQLEAALVAIVTRAKPNELSNTLWACAELLYFPERLLSALQQQQLWNMLLPLMNSQGLANTALAIGALGHRDEQLMGSILQQAVKILQQKQQRSSSSGVTGQFNVQEVCNLCWAIAVLDLQHYAAEVVYIMGTCSDQWDSLVLTNLSQVQQVHLWLQDMQQPQAMGLQTVFSEQQLQHCNAVWAAQAQQCREQQSSAFESEVFRLLQLLPVTWQIRPAMEQLSEPDHMFSIDISVVTADGVRLAVEVDGPTHFREPDRGLTGNTLYRNRALAARGYVIISVASHEWDQLPSQHQRLQYLQQLLQKSLPQLKLTHRPTAVRKQQNGSTSAKQAKRQIAQIPAARLPQLNDEPTD